MKIVLSLPAKQLSPNWRGHWRPKSQVTRQARKKAMLATLAMLHPGKKFEDRIYRYSLEFFFPDLRKRDDDNALASTKAYRDGIADAMGIDDHSLKLGAVPVMSLDRKNPRIEITIA